MQTKAEQLSDTFIDEIIKAMALPQIQPWRVIFRLVLGRAALRFSRVILGLEYEVGLNGAMQGARWLLNHFVRGFEANGMELIPADGPLIIAANHPAAYDAMVISACISRPDYKIIIGDIPPYRFVPNISRHAIFSPDPQDTFGRMSTVRQAIQHLKDGGALLTFPRGGIEPDPDFMPDPGSEFCRWSRSLDIFLRSVPRTRVLVTAVSGVISKRIFHHPITWLRRARPDKQRLAFMYQMIMQVLRGDELFGLTPRVTFGELLGGIPHARISEEIELAARRTLNRHISIIHS